MYVDKRITFGAFKKELEPYVCASSDYFRVCNNVQLLQYVPHGGSGGGILPLGKNRPPVSPADHKRRQKVAKKLTLRQFEKFSLDLTEQNTNIKKNENEN